jgi:peptide/nickel transport system permease protein
MQIFDEEKRGTTIKGLKDFWWRFKKNRAALLGMCILIFYVLLAIFGGYIAPYESRRTGSGLPFIPPFKESGYIFGTDQLGRDLFSGYVEGAKVSCIVGFTAAGASAIIGITVGSVAGYFGGRVDSLLMRVTDMILVMPRLVLAFTMAAFFGSNILNIIFILSILSWPGNARQVRAQFLSIRELEFVSAAKSIGETKWSIMFREILPHALVPVIVTTSMAIGQAILLETGLSFLGLGDPRLPSWGLMLQDAQRQMRIAWWPAFFPGFAIFTLVLGTNLFGDGVNDALNPRLKER